jgi:diacylglycerol kinase family enzyme
MPGVFHLMNPSLRQTPWVSALTTFGRDLSQWALVTRQHPQHTETLLDWALKVNITRLVIWGGDGTLHRVVKGLWQRGALDKMELALVPAGTCNDLARYYGLSKECWGRWEASAPHGRLAHLTLAHMAWKSSTRAPVIEGEDVFINNAGFGRPRPSFERKDPPWRVLFSMDPIGVTARWDAGSLEGRYYFSLAALAPYFSGGLFFEPGVSPEEGLLRFYFVPARNKVRLAFRLLRGRLGRSLFDSKITKLTTNHLSIETDVPVWPQADGEPPGAKPARHIEFRVLPEKVKLWVVH